MFKQVWFCDFEFHAPAGNRPEPICHVAKELCSGEIVRTWLYGEPSKYCPYPTGKDSLTVAYHASAELGCHLGLGWKIPANILCLEAEFRALCSGRKPKSGYSLVGALDHFNLETISAALKDEGRNLGIRGGPFTAEEKELLLRYCETDVHALHRLFGPMQQRIDWPYALIRGRYTAAVAAMEAAGVPLDVASLAILQQHWGSIKGALIERVDAGRGVFEGHTFSRKRFAAWLLRMGLPWPRYETGELKLDRDTFHEMAKVYPDEIGPVSELREDLAQLRLNSLTVGSDNRNRALLWQFSSKTGRNQPKSSKFIFGLSAWYRHLIQPFPGRALSYLDFSQQEFAIGAALSGDEAMQAAYLSGDPYLELAKRAGAIPPHGTKHTHRAIRNRYKTVCLAIGYGQGEERLAANLGVSPVEAKTLISHYKRVFSKFWGWGGAAIDACMINGRIRTRLAWPLYNSPESTPRTIRNFPNQANGSDIMRIAAIAATESGIIVNAPVHDAFLIEAREQDIEQEVFKMRAIMQRAGETILGGFPLRVDSQIVRYPDRYQDERGTTFWNTVWQLILEQNRLAPMGDLCQS